MTIAEISEKECAEDRHLLSKMVIWSINARYAISRNGARWCKLALPVFTNVKSHKPRRYGLAICTKIDIDATAVTPPYCWAHARSTGSAGR